VQEWSANYGTGRELTPEDIREIMAEVDERWQESYLGEKSPS
jgi:hypothetical protein